MLKLSDYKSQQIPNHQKELASARPLGPNTSKATTPITKASGAPTPNKEA